MGAAGVSVEKWLLAVDGMVERPFTITFDELRSMPAKTVTSFHECYGSPLVPPTKALRRIGNVNWTGVPLSELLARAKPLQGAKFVWSEGLDRGSFGGIEADRYQKDLPINKALEPEALVAYEMNSQRLDRRRGGPVRLIVPGYFGTNSTKWLSKLSVQPERASGHFTTTFYNEKYPPDDPQCPYKPIWEVQPNSMITKPAPNAEMSGPLISVDGWAWSYDGIESVSVSADDGKSWIESVVDERADFSWQRFHINLKLSPGAYTLVARAVAKDGRSQPMKMGRNHVHRVRIDVRPEN